MKQVYKTILSTSAAASANGAAWDTNQLVSASFQSVTADATAAGTIKLQYSNDNPNPSGHGFTGDFVPTNWTDIPNASVTVTAGDPIPGLVIANMAFGHVRAVFTRSAGAAVIIKVLAFGLSV